MIRWRFAVAVLLCLAAPVRGRGQGQPGEVLGVTIEPGERVTRLTIRMSRAVRAIITLRGRTGVSVLLPETHPGSLPEELPLDTGGIRSIAARLTPEGARLELLLARPLAVRQTTLPGERAVVLDIGGEDAPGEVFSRPEIGGMLTPRLPEALPGADPAPPEPGPARSAPPAGPPAPSAPQPGLLTGLRVEPAGHWLRLHLETNAPVILRKAYLKGAVPRYFVDLEGVMPGALQLPELPPGTLVTGLRVGKNSTRPPVTRIVLDLKPGTKEEETRPPVAPSPVLVVSGQPVPPEPQGPEARPEPPPLPDLLRGFTVAIDAGHGGGDPGASGSGLDEKDVTLDVAIRLYRWLRSRGCQVKMSRFTDRSLPPPVRTAWLKQNTSDLLVSVHCDSVAGRPNAAGTTTYFHRAHSASRLLAESVQQALVATLKSPDLGVRSDVSRYDRGFYVLRAADRPSVLVEVGYISHAPTARLLSDASYRDRVAQGLGSGIAAYLARRSPSRTAER